VRCRIHPGAAGAQSDDNPAPLGTLTPRVLLADLKKRPRGWLFQAARQMEKSVLADFADYSSR